jgi:AAA+ superfamily predicted ATPase
MKNRPPTLRLHPGPYTTSGEHLRDELARIDLLVRAQVVRWQMTIGAQKPENLWGMVHVTEAEITHYLATDVAPPDHTPNEVLDAVGPFRTAEGEAAEHIKSAVAMTDPDVDLRVNRLCQTLELTPIERDILLLCLLPEIDVRYRRIFGYLQDDASRAHPTMELLLQILLHKVGSIEGARSYLEPAEPLLRNRILVWVAQDEGRSSRFIRLDDRIGSFLLGSDESEIRLKGILSEFSGTVGWEDLLVGPALLAQLRNFAEYAKGRSATVVLHGPFGSCKEKAAQAICTEQNMPIMRFRVDAALRDPTKWERSVDLAYREARLIGSAVYIDGVERLVERDRSAHDWEYLLCSARAFHGITFFADESQGDSSRRFPDSGLMRFEFPVPHFELRRRIWLEALQPETFAANRDSAATTLAAAFQLTEGQVRDAVSAACTSARVRSFSNPQITEDDLREACRKQSSRRLLGFARRIEPTRQLTLDDVILSEPNKAQLRELLTRVRLRNRVESEMNFGQKITLGKGLVILFTGPPGTGKTFCAELIANQQGIDLYKVDISAIVSKWVGETEQNLSRVFTEAEDSNALLFFDECDSLFGQRGEIASEASGRWANLQVNYLLTRVEEYSGVVVMATNLRKNIDEAFIRRIQVIIDFPTPDAGMRFQIWKRILPGSSTALSDQDLQAISERLALTGGNMRNASIEAAFRALGAGREKITVRDVVDSIAREYQKLGKPITQGEFGSEFYSWAVADILAPIPAG